MTNSRMLSTEIAGYIARETRTGYILCESGEFLPDSLVGVGQSCARVYKTMRGALRGGQHRPTTAHPVNSYGIEISWVQERLAQGMA